MKTDNQHPAFQRTFWVNLYPNGNITSALCATKDEALNRSTYTGDIPDAAQVEVQLVPKQFPVVGARTVGQRTLGSLSQTTTGLFYDHHPTGTKSGDRR